MCVFGRVSCNFGWCSFSLCVSLVCLPTLIASRRDVNSMHRWVAQQRVEMAREPRQPRVLRHNATLYTWKKSPLVMGQTAKSQWEIEYSVPLCVGYAQALIFRVALPRNLIAKHIFGIVFKKEKSPLKSWLIPSVYPPVNLLHKHCWSRCCCHRRRMLQLFLHKPPRKLFPQAVKVITLTCIVYGS